MRRVRHGRSVLPVKRRLYLTLLVVALLLLALPRFAADAVARLA